MSAGHAHTRANLKHPAELARILARPGVRAYLARPFAIDDRHDIVDLAGYNVAGDTYFVDRHFAAAARAGDVTIAGAPATLEQLLVPLIGPAPGRPGHERGWHA